MSLPPTLYKHVIYFNLGLLRLPEIMITTAFPSEHGKKALTACQNALRFRVLTFHLDFSISS